MGGDAVIATRAILHVDMDAFYASVEQRDEPSLRGKPVLVGGGMRRGVVTAASYEARKFGARSAMPMAEALRLCPRAIVVPPRMRRYAEVSAQVFDVFLRYTPLVEGLSLDEAFLDVTASAALFGDGPTIARRIKDDITRELTLTASAGVARCKFAAKIASDLEKPDGLVVVPDDIATFLAPLPVEKMWGIGPKTAPRMRDAGYRTIGDLARAPAQRLEGLLGSWGLAIRELANGRDARDVSPDGAARSIGAEETFDDDLVTREDLERRLLAQSERVAQRLVATGQAGRTIVVKLKWSDFTVKSRRMTLPEPVCDTDAIYAAAKTLLDRFALEGARIRLTGVSVAEIGPEGAAPTLFPDEERVRQTKLEHLVKDLRGKFGGAAITRAALKREELWQRD